MNSFIYDVIKDLINSGENCSKLTFVLPSKRAGLFLKQELAKALNKTTFSPEIINVETFIENLADLKTVTNTELLFEFYTIYCELTPKESQDTFELFSKWAQILLQDFNEIDRYLLNQDAIFNYLSAIKELEHWSLQENKTDVVKNYLAFWNKLNIYYNAYTTALVTKKIAYQGLVYRKASENIQNYIDNNPNKKHVFIGFNALNTAEETLFQKLLEADLAKVYWDIDDTFFNSPMHDAALFTKRYKTDWKYFKKQPFNWLTNNYSEKKNIKILGIPKATGQAKAIGSILKKLSITNPELKKTAVVLGEENLLIPVLNSIPKGLAAINITMGFPLSSIPLASLFELLFNIQKNTNENYYYKDVISILNHQYIKPLLTNESEEYSQLIVKGIKENNIAYVTVKELKKLGEPCSKLIELLFLNWKNNSQKAIENCFKLISLLKDKLSEDKDSNTLSLEYLFRFNTLFNELYRLNESYNYLNTISSLYSVYKELLSSETLDFQGEPLEGLQIMGVLESRVLDFETVIISSVNEGILPSGKSNNSYIPFDVKIENKLPTYKEKDAIYTYHFYRLLQRAKNVFILYNTEIDTLTGGEKSRFINQLELEGIHKIEHQIITPQTPLHTNALRTIKKSEAVLVDIKNLAEKGFSPSSLTNYIRNPIDFYYQKLLGVRDIDDVEETVAANTMGTVVHNTLEELYTPYININLTISAVESMKKRIEPTVISYFKKEYKEGDMTKGKNRIILEIAKRYVSNFLSLELSEIKAGNTIKILALEASNKIVIPIPELNFEVKLNGTVDRIDEFNGTQRIIDYKTGKVEQNKVEIIDWEDLNTDYTKYSKSFQILCYAYLFNDSKTIQFPIEAGIISFKNLNSGFLKFAKKDKAYGGKKNTLITEDTLVEFYEQLKKLIIEICNPNIDFIEKEV